MRIALNVLSGLDYVFLGNSVQQWLVATAMGVLAFIALRLIQRVAVERLTPLADRADAFAAEGALELVRRTRWYFFVAIAVTIGTRALTLAPGLRHFVGRALILVVLFQIGRWASNLIGVWVDRFAEQRTLTGDVGSVTTVRALGVAAQLLFWLVVAITILETVFDYDVTALVTGLGIVGIAVALAVQNILGDLLAALSIVLDKPFVVGDFIVVGDKRGTVEQIGLKTTRLRSIGGEQLIFSNAELLKSIIHNFKRMYERRVLVNFDVHLQTDREVLASLPGVLREVIESKSPVRFDRSHLATITDRGFRLEAVFHMLDPAYNAYMDVQQQVILEMLAHFEQSGVRLARTMLEEKIIEEV